jgi:lysozyme family protein
VIDLSFGALKQSYSVLWSRVIAAGGIIRTVETQKQAETILAPEARARFEAVEKITGVPWFVTGIVSVRESGSPPNFHAWLHNGDPMFDHAGNPRRTVDVPADRPSNPACSWEDGCHDAYEIEGLLFKTGWSSEFVAWLLEKFNGFGYRVYHNIRSPYLWGGTVVQQRGKYDADRSFNPSIMDSQIGGMALLAMLMKLDSERVKF